MSDLYSTIAALVYLLAKIVSQYGVQVRRREEIAIGSSGVGVGVVAGAQATVAISTTNATKMVTNFRLFKSFTS